MRKLFNWAISLIPLLILLSFIMPGLNIPIIKYVPILVGEAFQLLESEEQKKIRLERERAELEFKESLRLLGQEIKKLSAGTYVKYLLGENPSMPVQVKESLEEFTDKAEGKKFIDYQKVLVGRFYIGSENKIGEHTKKGFLDYKEIFGDRVKKDPDLGLKLLRKAAESNRENIQIELMYLYNFEEHVKQDKLLAYMYGRLALAHQKSSKAQDIIISLMGEVKDGMTESEIAQGERLASLCKGKNYKNCGY